MEEAMKRVVVVDDHAYIRETLVELLDNELDLAVVGSGADGAAAIALADQLEPDVVVMDARMPGIDGAVATEEILRRRPLTWVIVLTSAPDGHLATRALAAGARACLAKSGSYSALVDAIRAA
jgi:DNA-binding NarL/FixJ family response regulator